MSLSVEYDNPKPRLIICNTEELETSMDNLAQNLTETTTSMLKHLVSLSTRY